MKQINRLPKFSTSVQEDQKRVEIIIKNESLPTPTLSKITPLWVFIAEQRSLAKS